MTSLGIRELQPNPRNGLPKWRAEITQSGKGMPCPKCAAKTGVYDSRPRPDGTLRRNRGCGACGHRFTTIEAPASALTSPEYVEALVTELRALADKVEKLLPTSD